MNRISSFQAGALAFCFALARMIAFRPEGENLLICIIAEVFACIILAALGIAAGGLPSLKNGLGAKVLSVLTAVYYLFAAALILSVFAQSMRYCFPEFYSTWAVITSLAAGAAYCASMGATGCGRTACAAVVLALAVLLFTALGAVRSFDMTGLHLAVTDKSGRLVRHFVWALGYSFELPLIFTLRGHITKPGRAALFYCIARAVLWAVMLALCGTVLKGQGETGLPFFTLAAYSKTALVERFDAAVLLMWTLCTLLSLAILITGIHECMGRLFKCGNVQTGAFAVISAVGAFVMTGFGAYGVPSLILASALLLVIIPASLSGRSYA